MKKVYQILDVINIPKHIVSHMIGEKHSTWHHRITGAIIMVFGVGVVKIFYITSDIGLFHFVGDLVGFAIHGVGLVPWVSKIEKGEEEVDKPVPETQEATVQQFELEEEPA